MKVDRWRVLTPARLTEPRRKAPTRSMYDPWINQKPSSQHVLAEYLSPSPSKSEFSIAKMAFTEGQTLDNMLGSLFVGSLLAGNSLYGVTSLQAYSYYHWFHSRDSLVHRIAVGLLWCLDTLHFVLVVHGVYYYCVSSFGSSVHLSVLVWSMKLQIVINVIIILLVQGLYAYRVWLLGGYHNKIIAYVTVAIVAIAFGVGMVLAHYVYAFSPKIRHDAKDAYIHGSRVIPYQTLVIRSLFLSLVAIINLRPHGLVYINSFLAMLNARERHPHAHTHVHHSDPAHHPDLPHAHSRLSTSLSVHIPGFSAPFRPAPSSSSPKSKSAPLSPSFMTPVPVPMKLNPSLSAFGKGANEIGSGMGMIGIGVEMTKSESSQSRSSLSKEPSSPSSPPSPSHSLRSSSPSPLPTLGHGHGHGTGGKKELGDDDTVSSEGNDNDNEKVEDRRYPW
ncbi:hypothetical protein EYR40_000006 [Pleurotus pulmonarius]|nr:hypothetical protein EYR40_000006 [Pleurotus pulmonarius]